MALSPETDRYAVQLNATNQRGGLCLSGSDASATAEVIGEGQVSYSAKLFRDEALVIAFGEADLMSFTHIQTVA